jgi:hypothetical protein
VQIQVSTSLVVEPNIQQTLTPKPAIGHGPESISSMFRAHNIFFMHFLVLLPRYMYSLPQHLKFQYQMFHT